MQEWQWLRNRQWRTGRVALAGLGACTTTHSSTPGTGGASGSGGRSSAGGGAVAFGGSNAAGGAATSSTGGLGGFRKHGLLPGLYCRRKDEGVVLRPGFRALRSLPNRRANGNPAVTELTVGGVK